MSMRSWKAVFLPMIASLLLAGAVLPAAADSGGVTRFATLPQGGAGNPEGLAADAAGNIYAASFDFDTPNVIYVFSPSSGHLMTTIPLAGHLPLGLAFNAAGDLFVADFGNGVVLRFAPPFTSSSTPAQTYTVCPGGGASTGCGLNAMTFDAAGNLYVSDSFGGRIFKLNPATAAPASVFILDEMLKPGSHGFPPFGANGLAFDAAGTMLYIANTADDRILRYELATLTLSTFAESINGADGIVFDDEGRLWVAANQADEVVALNSRGRVVERRGSFDGIGHDGAAKGLIFPASIVISRGDMYVTNTALALTPAVGDEPEEDVTTYTVSRFSLRP
jgi:sugar lactone lactonase YvrE